MNEEKKRKREKRVYDEAFRRKPGKTSAAAVQSEMARLRRENQNLKAQRDILKKALGILAEPSSNASRA
jgi:transposase-like protein